MGLCNSVPVEPNIMDEIREIEHSYLKPVIHRDFEISSDKTETKCKK